MILQLDPEGQLGGSGSFWRDWQQNVRQTQALHLLLTLNSKYIREMFNSTDKVHPYVKALKESLSQNLKLRPDLCSFRNGGIVLVEY